MPLRGARRVLTRPRAQLLVTGSHAMSSVLSKAKKYPRVLLIQGDRLLCCKHDDMDLCTYKWMKKARHVAVGCVAAQR